VIEYRPREPAAVQPLPSVSVLLPTYNGARFLDAQVHSVLAQTLSTFELLVYDDGSTDGTWPILQAHAQSDPRIRAWQGSANAGQGAALTLLLGQAQAPLMSFCDQDDVWAPDKLERLITALGDADLAYGCSRLIDEHGTMLGPDIFQFVGPPIAGRDPVLLLPRNTVSAHAMLVRRACIRPHHFNGSFDFDHLIAMAAAAGNGVVYVPEAITYHRIHGGNQVHGSLANWARHRKSKVRAKIKAHKMRAMVALTGAVAGGPHVSPLRLQAFGRLNAIANEVLASKGHIFGASLDVGEVEALLRSVSADEEAIGNVVRRFRKLARGPLHPANWLRVLS
jgi:glycosyltransferase involved in cell wall biosynthesis